MKNKKKSGRFFSKILFSLDFIRRLVLNLLFWGFIVFVIYSLVPPRVKIESGSVLMLQPAGSIVEKNDSDPLPDWMSSFTGEVIETTLLSLSKRIRTAAEDERITALYMDLSALQYASLASLQELVSDLEYFRSMNKKVISWSSYYNLYSTYLASVSDYVYMDPMGSVNLPGYSVYRSYYGEALDKWNIEVAYFHAGEFKSYGEPFIASKMSENMKEENQRWLDNLWSQYLRVLGSNRSLGAEDIRRWINDYPELIKDRTEGEAAVDAGLIDGIVTPIQLEKELVKLTGVNRSDMIRGDNYSPFGTADIPGVKDIYVLTASGQIHGGESRMNSIGSDSILRQLESISQDKNIGALVLRLDTGGGSAFASELIRRKLMHMKQKGMKIIVSMAGVTASGGYWIASAADEIWAAPGTITGSIGVFTMVPQISGFMEETLGLHSDGVGTTWMSGQGRLDQPLNNQSRSVFQTTVNQTYSQFLEIVSESRNLSVEQVKPLAEGRIWTGREALDLGLTDHTGTLAQAVEGAADLARLEDYRVRYHKEEPLSMNDILGGMQLRAGQGLSAVLKELIVPEAEGILNLRPGQVYALSPLFNP